MLLRKTRTFSIQSVKHEMIDQLSDSDKLKQFNNKVNMNFSLSCLTSYFYYFSIRILLLKEPANAVCEKSEGCGFEH